LAKPPPVSAEGIIGAAYDELASFAAAARAALSEHQPLARTVAACPPLAQRRSEMLECIAVSRDLADRAAALLPPSVEAAVEVIGETDGGVERSTCLFSSPACHADEPASETAGSPHLRRDWARPCHIGIRTRLTAARSVPGLGSPPATSAPGLGSPLPHLH
jgi:hypothetical protein